MTESTKILLVEDDSAIASSLSRMLTRAGYRVAVSARGDTGLEQALQEHFDLVLTDFKLPGLNGLDLAGKLHAAKPLLPTIVMTAHGTAETAIEATKLGAYDYLLKPFDAEELLELVGKAVASSRLASKPVDLGEAGSGRDALIGKSRAMQSVYKEIGRVAAKPLTVLIQGETGTGKELIARAIHQHSDRAGNPFVAVNCGAIPEALLESELFGHERGAFTGAESRRIGRFEQAHGGSIFLDEIGELNLSTQVKLLRVLQERSIQRLGGKEDIALDVRVIAATNRDLEKAITEKEFRDDLYYRLNVAQIRVPPLRERREDIPLLIQYFLRRYSAESGNGDLTMTPEGIAFLQDQTWPGNVRELENVVRKAMLAGRGYTIGLETVREAMNRSEMPQPAPHQSMQAYISEVIRAAARGEVTDAQRVIFNAVEREMYSQAIAQAGGNLTRTATWLGVTRVTAREKLTAFGLRVEPPVSGAGPG
ncbi:sigma-54-dependent transcriptional regulator [Verrucomicrobiota bacterium sgz303538]